MCVANVLRVYSVPMKLIRLFLSFFTFLSASLLCAQSFQLASVFTDNMVLQRQLPSRIFGKAARWTAVSARLLQNDAEDAAPRVVALSDTVQVAKDGRFLLTFPALEAGGPYELEVTAGEESSVLHNVWLGEVWLCGGQSNMELKVSDTDVARYDLPLADSLPRIHLYNMESLWTVYGGRWSRARADSIDKLMFIPAARWEMSSRQGAAHFSAIGFAFARYLSDSLGCHVGVICNAVGGSTVEDWIDTETLSQRVGKVLEGDWRENPNIQPWARNRGKENLTGVRGKHRHPYEPTYLYDCGIRPLEGLRLRGILWYQGESNDERPKLYSQLFRALEESWRKAFGDNRLPFYTVQLSSYAPRKMWGTLRNVQRKLASRLPNTYLTVCHDVGEEQNIHPKYKRIVAKRLALQVLHHTYGRTDIACESSQPDSLGTGARHSEAVLYFPASAGVLSFTGKEKPALFELCGASEQWFPATHVSISGTQIRLSSPRVGFPLKVRYGFKPYFTGGIVNSAGLPTPTFEISRKKK